MFINFLNLNCGDVEDFLNGKAERESCYILCVPKHVALLPIDIKNHKVWAIFVTTEYGVDPKLHFTDEIKAKEAYGYLSAVVGGTSIEYLDVDALTLGCI